MVTYNSIIFNKIIIVIIEIIVIIIIIPRRLLLLVFGVTLLRLHGIIIICVDYSDRVRLNEFTVALKRIDRPHKAGVQVGACIFYTSHRRSAAVLDGRRPLECFKRSTSRVFSRRPLPPPLLRRRAAAGRCRALWARRDLQGSKTRSGVGGVGAHRGERARNCVRACLLGGRRTGKAAAVAPRARRA